MNGILQKLHENRVLRDIDIQFARRMSEVFRAADCTLFFAVLFHTVSSAHTCLRTDKLSILSFYDEYKSELDETFSPENIQKLIKRGLVAEAPSQNSPFIHESGRLYLKAFYRHEKVLSEYIDDAVNTRFDYDTDRLGELMIKYFGAGENLQKAAALNVCLNRFSVISGGPGTGKTTTVFKVLAVLTELADAPPSIAVCAPTGKAAARLTESIRKSSAELSADFDNIPSKAVTLHRLLKMTGDSEKCGYDSENPMPYDIVVADESSMVDLRMMSLLVQSLKNGCRFILLGDKDQLASVQPGSVLGDICAFSDTDRFSTKTAELMSICTDTHVLTTDNPYADITIQLKKSHRFDDTKGIGLLAKACRDGDILSALDVMKNDSTAQIDFVDISDNPEQIIKNTAESCFRTISAEKNAKEALRAMSSFIILTPTVKGQYGFESINMLILNHLYRRGLRDNTKKYFHGLPIMITENDYNLNLHNGTTGLIFENNGLKAVFEDDEKERFVSVLRLPPWSPVFAMTVHKSQGSEFDHVMLILPESTSPIMTSELFYTAVTRAKKRLTVVASDTSVRQCLSGKTERYSGLAR